MTDKEQTQQFVLQKIYTKDLSFETPNSPKVFTKEFTPNINVELNTSSQIIEENIYEVVLGITVTVKLEETTAYLVEVHQAGIFNIKGFPEQDLGPMLGSYCPSVLFPYAREVISDLVTKGGFPQLLLQPVNFDAIYREHLAAAQSESDDSGTGEHAVH